MDNDINDIATASERRNERERILRERGYDPDELTDEEQARILENSLEVGEGGRGALTKPSYN